MLEVGAVSAELSTGWLVAGCVVAVLTAVAVVGYPVFLFRSFLRGRRESADLPEERKTFARTHGLTYAPEDHSGIVDLDLELLSQILHSPYRIRNLASGIRHGWQVAVFDLEVAGAYGDMGEGAFFRRDLCVFVHLPFTVPEFVLHPRRQRFRLLDWLTDAKPPCEHHAPALSSHYVCARDGEWFERFLRDGGRDWLVERAPGLRFEAGDGVVVGSRRWVPRSWGIMNPLFGSGPNVPPLKETLELASRAQRMASQ